MKTETGGTPKTVLAKTQTKEASAEKTVVKKPAKKSRCKPARSTTAMAKAYPMVSLINEVVAKQIPPELVARVKGTKNKKKIISSIYPYARVMRKNEYERQIALLQIELVKMQAWAINSGEKIVLIYKCFFVNKEQCGL
jgi:hypothetical protein